MHFVAFWTVFVIGPVEKLVIVLRTVATDSEAECEALKFVGPVQLQQTEHRRWFTLHFLTHLTVFMLCIRLYKYQRH